MGIGKKSPKPRSWTSCRTDDNCSPTYYSANTTSRLPNPDPSNFRVIKQEQVGSVTVVKVKYPDCTNYEGNKIMVYRATLNEILAQPKLDPHFCEGKHLSPIARFAPTEEGWKLAVRFAGSM